MACFSVFLNMEDVFAKGFRTIFQVLLSEGAVLPPPSDNHRPRARPAYPSRTEPLRARFDAPSPQTSPGRRGTGGRAGVRMGLLFHRGAAGRGSDGFLRPLDPAAAHRHSVGPGSVRPRTFILIMIFPVPLYSGSCSRHLDGRWGRRSSTRWRPIRDRAPRRPKLQRFPRRSGLTGLLRHRNIVLDNRQHLAQAAFPGRSIPFDQAQGGSNSVGYSSMSSLTSRPSPPTPGRKS